MEEKILVGDVGGTNARFALCDLQTGALSSYKTYSTSHFSSLELTVSDYLHDKELHIDKACIAIACPVDGDQVHMTNHNWSFSTIKLKENLKFKMLEVINDFHANAMAIPTLQSSDLITISDFKANKNKPITILGAGTGLGVAHVLPWRGEWVTLPGEGGHVEFAACNDKEYEILKILHQEFGRVSVERILSGPGVVNLYKAYMISENKMPNDFTPEEITGNAIRNECEDCHETLSLFCTILGRFAGSLALTFNSQGGVYISGGIVPRFSEFLKASGFRKAFTEKGRFKRYVGDVPVHIVTHKHIGLLGAGAFLRQKLGLTLGPVS